jgi:hypothetical protein
MKSTLNVLTALLLAPLAALSAALLLLPLARLHALCGAACRRLLAAVGYPMPAMETLHPAKPPTPGSARNYARDWRSRMPAFLFSGLTPTSGVLDRSFGQK